MSLESKVSEAETRKRQKVELSHLIDRDIPMSIPTLSPQLWGAILPFCNIYDESNTKQVNQVLHKLTTTLVVGAPGLTNLAIDWRSDDLFQKNEIAHPELKTDQFKAWLNKAWEMYGAMMALAYPDADAPSYLQEAVTSRDDFFRRFRRQPSTFVIAANAQRITAAKTGTRELTVRAVPTFFHHEASLFLLELCWPRLTSLDLHLTDAFRRTPLNIPSPPSFAARLRQLIRPSKILQRFVIDRATMDSVGMQDIHLVDALKGGTALTELDVTNAEITLDFTQTVFPWTRLRTLKMGPWIEATEDVKYWQNLSKSAPNLTSLSMQSTDRVLVHFHGLADWIRSASSRLESLLLPDFHFPEPAHLTLDKIHLSVWNRLEVKQQWLALDPGNRTLADLSLEVELDQFGLEVVAWRRRMELAEMETQQFNLFWSAVLSCANLRNLRCTVPQHPPDTPYVLAKFTLDQMEEWMKVFDNADARTALLQDAHRLNAKAVAQTIFKSLPKLEYLVTQTELFAYPVYETIVEMKHPCKYFECENPGHYVPDWEPSKHVVQQILDQFEYEPKFLFQSGTHVNFMLQEATRDKLKMPSRKWLIEGSRFGYPVPEENWKIFAQEILPSMRLLQGINCHIKYVDATTLLRILSKCTGLQICQLEVDYSPPFTKAAFRNLVDNCRDLRVLVLSVYNRGDARSPPVIPLQIEDVDYALEKCEHLRRLSFFATRDDCPLDIDLAQAERHGSDPSARFRWEKIGRRVIFLATINTGLRVTFLDKTNTTRLRVERDVYDSDPTESGVFVPGWMVYNTFDPAFLLPF